MCWEKKSEISPIPSARNARAETARCLFGGRGPNDYWPVCNEQRLLITGLLYGAGLRLMQELTRLRVKDIDMDLNTLTVRSGKGR